jgi:hypothetical protein
LTANFNYCFFLARVIEENAKANIDVCFPVQTDAMLEENNLNYLFGRLGCFSSTTEKWSHTARRNILVRWDSNLKGFIMPQTLIQSSSLSVSGRRAVYIII